MCSISASHNHINTANIIYHLLFIFFPYGFYALFRCFFPFKKIWFWVVIQFFLLVALFYFLCEYVGDCSIFETLCTIEYLATTSLLLILSSFAPTQQIFILYCIFVRLKACMFTYTNTHGTGIFEWESAFFCASRSGYATVAIVACRWCSPDKRHIQVQVETHRHII